MSNKNKELAEAVYKELFPTAEEMKTELTRAYGNRFKGEQPVRNQQVLITSSDEDKSW